MAVTRRDAAPAFNASTSDASTTLRDRTDSTTTEPKRRASSPVDDETLQRVVAAAYRVGGRRPVHAVKEALEATGALSGPITIDQARRAVVRARARGFIPPAKSGAEREKDQA